MVNITEYLANLMHILLQILCKYLVHFSLNCNFSHFFSILQLNIWLQWHLLTSRGFLIIQLAAKDAFEFLSS